MWKAKEGRVVRNHCLGHMGCSTAWLSLASVERLQEPLSPLKETAGLEPDSRFD